jgi:hypothetical protein
VVHRWPRSSPAAVQPLQVQGPACSQWGRRTRRSSTSSRRSRTCWSFAAGRQKRSLLVRCLTPSHYYLQPTPSTRTWPTHDLTAHPLMALTHPSPGNWSTAGKVTRCSWLSTRRNRPQGAQHTGPRGPAAPPLRWSPPAARCPPSEPTARSRPMGVPLQGPPAAPAARWGCFTLDGHTVRCVPCSGGLVSSARSIVV